MIPSNIAALAELTTKQETPWPAREELPPTTPPAPTLPSEMVPEPLRPWQVDVAERACIPLEYVAGPTVVGLGAVVGRGVGIRPEQFDDWTVVPNLWGGIVGRPGLMKTYAIQEALRPLRRLAAAANERYEAEESSWQARRARLQAEVEAIKAQMTKAAKAGQDPSNFEAELASKLDEMRESTPTERRYFTQDATVEKLAVLLKENPRGLLILRDELAGWLRTMDRPGREGEREFYLEAWNGNGSFTVDRIERGTIHIPALCLSVVGGIQPGKLQAYISDALREGFRDDGFLQRVQVLVWPDRPGEWRPVKRWPDTEARRRAYEVFAWLDRLVPTQIGAQIEEESIPYLRFNEAAQAVWDEWRAELENRLRSEELAHTPAFESHLAKYRSLMPSLALIFHLVNMAAGLETSPVVSEGAACLAAAWCEFLEAHARKVYAEEIMLDAVAAHRLAHHIKEGRIRDGDTVREIQRHEWTGLTTPEMVDAGLRVLEKAHWVRVERVDTGGRPSYVVRLHPELREGRGA